MTRSLGFDLLDVHVVHGRADEPAVVGSHTFARLLERAAAIAAGLGVIGVGVGTPVRVELEGVVRVEVVCACIRLGALPGTEGDARVVLDDGEPWVHVGAESHPLDLVRRAGSSDPAMALADDAEGYRERVLALVPDVVEPLLAGRPVG